MVGDEAVPRDGAGASPLATEEAEGAFGYRGSPGLQEGRELTSRDDLAQRPRTDDLRAVWGLSGVPPANPEEKEAALDQEPPGTERGWGGVEAGRCGVCGRLPGLGAPPRLIPAG